MNAPPFKKPLLLLLEDDEIRAVQLARQAENVGWDVEIAGSIEAALKCSRHRHADIKMTVVDVMVPELDEDLEVLRTFQKKVRDLIGPILKEYQETKSDLDRRIDLDANRQSLDVAMRSLIVPDGGFLFLEEAKGEGWLANWNYAIFSATSEPDGMERLRQIELARENDGKWMGWLSKPVDPDVIELMLKTAIMKV
jgi:CheY-like chemotaxis protein